MSVIKRGLCTVLSAAVILTGIAAATKSRSADVLDPALHAADSESAESPYVSAALPQYKWAHDENAEPQELLETVLREKELDERMQALVLAAFDQLTRNYGDAYTVLRSSGVPELRAVQMNYVSAVAHTKAFKTYSGSTFQFKGTNLYIGNSCGFYWSRYDLMCMREDCLAPTKDTCDLFLHEMMHAHQDVYLDSSYNDRDCGDLWRGMQYVLIEGDAQLYSAAYSENIESFAPSTYKFDDDTQTCLIQKGRTHDKKYNMVYKLNTVMQYLLGYDTMQLLRYQPDTKREEAFLSQKYGVDGEAFMHACALLGLNAFTGSERTEKNGQVVLTVTPVNAGLLAYVDKTFIACLAQDIRNIDSEDRQAVEDFFHFYRFYKLQYQPQACVTADGKETDVTDAFFGNDAVENELYEKCQKAGLLRFTRNEAKNRAAFDALLDADALSSGGYLSLSGIRISYNGDTLSFDDSGKRPGDRV